jgi:hypothetical protein
MTEHQQQYTTGSPATIDQALQKIVSEILAGIDHGFFEFTVSCEIVNGGRRRLTLRAGKSYQFLLPKEECVPQPTTATPDTGACPNQIKGTRGIVGMTSTRQAPLGSRRELRVADAERA